MLNSPTHWVFLVAVWVSCPYCCYFKSWPRWPQADWTTSVHYQHKDPPNLRTLAGWTSPAQETGETLPITSSLRAGYSAVLDKGWAILTDTEWGLTPVWGLISPARRQLILTEGRVGVVRRLAWITYQHQHKYSKLTPTSSPQCSSRRVNSRDMSAC